MFSYLQILFPLPERARVRTARSHRQELMSDPTIYNLATVILSNCLQFSIQSEATSDLY
jgi:hypothetical protein